MKRAYIRLSIAVIALVLTFSTLSTPQSSAIENSSHFLMGQDVSESSGLEVTASEGVSDGYSPEALFMSADWDTELPCSEEILMNTLNPSNPNGIIDEIKTDVSQIDYNNSFVDKSSECTISTQEAESENSYLLLGPTGTDVGNPYEPSQYRRQELQSPAKNGHWFQYEGESFLSFMVDLSADVMCLLLRIDIEPDQDTYARRFRVYFDGVACEDETIYPEGSNPGYHDSVPVWWVSAGEHRIELKINWGAHVSHAWKLTYIQPFEYAWPEAGNPILAFWEYFPQDTNSLLEYEVKGGTNTKINLWTENDNDPSSRNLKVYVNGALKYTVTSPGSYEKILYYSPPDGTSFTLGLELVGSDTYYGKRINFNHVSYRVQRLEIDRMQEVGDTGYMVTKAEVRDMVDYARTYHILRGFTRFDYTIDNDFIRHDGVITKEEFDRLRDDYFTWDYDPWQWCLIASKLYEFTTTALGMFVQGARKGFVIFESTCEYQAGRPGHPSILAYRRTSFLHEFNHNTGIIILKPNGDEDYCDNPECCMAEHNPDGYQNISENPWCCQYYWAERDPPWV